jgi:hypothetical protein
MRCLPRQPTRSINNIEMTFLRFPKTWGEVALHSPQFIFPLFGMCVLLIVEWLLETRLNSTVNGTHFAAGDGRMAEAVVRTGYQFAAFLHLTNLNPLQGFGSQLLPMNVWINPVHWPLAFLDGKLATDIAGLVALACFAAACYFMARCFDLPPLPSIIAAQLSMCWFGPLGPLLTFTASFVLLTGMAVVYAPYIAALGLLARLGPGRIRAFVWYTGAITALIFYSLCCDPLWSMVGATSWAVPFAVVAISPLRIKAILIRCAALGVTLALLLVSGALLYVYTLTQYNSRVFFPALMDRPFAPSYVSILLTSTNGKYFYGLCLLGWIAGLVSAVGRVRVLVVAGSAAFVFFVFYVLAYTLLDVRWWLPLPFYVEHSLAPLLMVSAFAGLWSAAQSISTAKSILARIRPSIGTIPRSAINVRVLAVRTWILFLVGSAGKSIITRIRVPLGMTQLGATKVGQRLAARRWILFVAGLLAVALVPLGGMAYSFERAKIVLARYYSTPWANEPELVGYLLQSTGLSVGQTYRGSSLEFTGNIVSTANLWKQGVPTLSEYSQLVTPQAFYLQTALLGSTPGLNGFGYGLVIVPGVNIDLMFKTLRALGVRHILSPSPLVEADKRQVPSVRVPRRPHDALPGAEPGIWHIYELPDPNMGNYSPTEIVVLDSAPEIIAILGAEDFDFRRRVVLSSGGWNLVPARDMRLTVNRGGGFHVSGKSDGMSLIILPQQFSHCMKASDSHVRIVRADLLWMGMIFSGSVDADISFGYGMFSPGCRRADIADMKRLGIVLPEPPPTGRQGIKEKFEASVNAFKAVW